MRLGGMIMGFHLFFCPSYCACQRPSPGTPSPITATSSDNGTASDVQGATRSSPLPCLNIETKLQFFKETPYFAIIKVGRLENESHVALKID